VTGFKRAVLLSLLLYYGQVMTKTLCWKKKQQHMSGLWCRPSLWSFNCLGWWYAWDHMETCSGCV